MGLFTDLFSTKPAEAAAEAKITGYNNAKSDANAALTTGQAGADTLYGQAGDLYKPIMANAGNGSDAYADATGANGAEGLARAGNLFRSATGYQGGLTTGVDQLARTAAARGDTGGNLSGDIIKFASDYDAQKYGNYVSNLAPWLGANQSAVTGAAGVKTGQAGVDLGVAGQKASNDWNAATGIGNANADKELAPYSASSNFWSSLMGLGNMALKASGVGGYAPSVKAA